MPGSCRTGAGIWQQPHAELLPGLLLASAGRDPPGTGTEVALCLPRPGSQSHFGIWPRVGRLWQRGSQRPQCTDPLYWGREGTATAGLPSWQLCPTGCAPIPNAGTAGYKGDNLQLPLSGHPVSTGWARADLAPVTPVLSPGNWHQKPPWHPARDTQRLPSLWHRLEAARPGCPRAPRPHGGSGTPRETAAGS